MAAIYKKIREKIGVNFAGKITYLCRQLIKNGTVIYFRILCESCDFFFAFDGLNFAKTKRKNPWENPWLSEILNNLA